MKKKPLLLFFFLIIGFVAVTTSRSTALPLTRKKAIVQRALSRLRKRLHPGRQHFLLVVDPKSGTILGSINKRGCFTKKVGPGSIFKLVTAYAMLQNRVISPHSSYYCRGKHFLYGPYRTGGRLIHEDEQFPRNNDYYKCSFLKGHGRITLLGALALSCNAFFYHNYKKVSTRTLIQTAYRLGLTRRVSHLTLYPAIPEFKPVNTHTERLLSVVGNAVLTTPAAMAQFLCTILNHGTTLKLQTYSPGRYPIKTGHNQNRAIFSFLQKSMRYCVTQGTGKAVQTRYSPSIAGKTGTAHQQGNIFKTDGWFISFAPYHKPSILIVALTTNSVGSSHPLHNSRRLYQLLTAAGFFRN